MAFKQLTEQQLPSERSSHELDVPYGTAHLTYHVDPKTTFNQGVAVWKLGYDNNNNNTEEFIIAWQGSSTDPEVGHTFQTNQRIRVDMWYINEHGRPSKELSITQEWDTNSDTVHVRGEDIGMTQKDNLLTIAIDAAAG